MHELSWLLRWLKADNASTAVSNHFFQWLLGPRQRRILLKTPPGLGPWSPDFVRSLRTYVYIRAIYSYIYATYIRRSLVRPGTAVHHITPATHVLQELLYLFVSARLPHQGYGLMLLPVIKDPDSGSESLNPNAVDAVLLLC